MANTDEKEIQKTLDDLKKKAEEFQNRKNYFHSPSNNFSSNSNLKLILTIVGVGIVLIISVIFYMKSGGNKIDTNKNYKSATFIFNVFMI